jgi:hypothetical protein
MNVEIMQWDLVLVLWDVEDKVYKDRIKKRDALVEMAEIFSMSTEGYTYNNQ